MNLNAMAIAVAEARHAIKDEKTLVGRLKKAMQKTRYHWMVVNEDERFRCACAAAILESPPDEAARIEEELKTLQKISAAFHAAQNGVPVDFGALNMEVENPIGLMKLWNKKEENRR